MGNGKEELMKPEVIFLRNNIICEMNRQSGFDA